MENEYKIQDFADIIGCDKKIIYDAKNRKELRTCEKRDDDTGRNNVTFIVATNAEILKFKEIYSKRTRNKSVKNMDSEEIFNAEYTKEPIREGNNNIQALDIINTLTNSLITTQKQVIEYAEKAGQVKLLEDSENRTKGEYFELLTENIQLKNRIEETEKQKTELLENVKILEAENQQFKQKSFFGIKFGK